MTIIRAATVEKTIIFSSRKIDSIYCRSNIVPPLVKCDYSIQSGHVIFLPKYMSLQGPNIVLLIGNGKAKQMSHTSM